MANQELGFWYRFAAAVVVVVGVIVIGFGATSIHNTDKKSNQIIAVSDDHSNQVMYVGAGATFQVTVDYSKNLAKMIKAGKYQKVNDNINKWNFEIHGVGKKKIAIVLVQLNNHHLSDDDVILEMDKIGLRPATLPELLALGAVHSDEYNTIALGSDFISGNGSRGHPCIGYWRGVRELGLATNDENEYASWYRFAAVRKEL